MQCTGAAKPGVFKWTITRRGPVIPQECCAFVPNEIVAYNGGNQLTEWIVMNRVTVNHNASSQLDGVSQPVQVFDENGKLLGHFVPTSSLDPSASCPFSDERTGKDAR